MKIPTVGEFFAALFAPEPGPEGGEAAICYDTRRVESAPAAAEPEPEAEAEP